jgi:hypothetical protein
VRLEQRKEINTPDLDNISQNFKVNISKFNEKYEKCYKYLDIKLLAQIRVQLDLADSGESPEADFAQ